MRRNRVVRMRGGATSGGDRDKIEGGDEELARSRNSVMQVFVNTVECSTKRWTLGWWRMLRG